MRNLYRSSTASCRIVWTPKLPTDPKRRYRAQHQMATGTNCSMSSMRGRDRDLRLHRRVEQFLQVNPLDRQVPVISSPLVSTTARARCAAAGALACCRWWRPVEECRQRVAESDLRWPIVPGPGGQGVLATPCSRCWAATTAARSRAWNRGDSADDPARLVGAAPRWPWCSRTRSTALNVYTICPARLGAFAGGCSASRPAELATPAGSSGERARGDRGRAQVFLDGPPLNAARAVRDLRLQLGATSMLSRTIESVLSDYAW